MVTHEIRISDSALERMKQIAREAPGKRLRVSVNSGGCQGFDM